MKAEKHHRINHLSGYLFRQSQLRRWRRVTAYRHGFEDYHREEEAEFPVDVIIELRDIGKYQVDMDHPFTTSGAWIEKQIIGGNLCGIKTVKTRSKE